MTPQEFIARWANNPLTERAGAQAHFDDLCDLLGVDKPRDPDNYCFERGAKKAGGGDGWADVWKRGHFGWENKSPKRDLVKALEQLRAYAGNLDNPPLQIVCDRERIEIHTVFRGYPDEPRTIWLKDIGDPANLQTLRWVFTDPDKLKPHKSNAAITQEVAAEFANLAKSMRTRGLDAQQVAHFLTQCIFCMFAEDEGLLHDSPTDNNAIFTALLKSAQTDTTRAAQRITSLFTAMQNDGGQYGNDSITWFNGGLFKKIDVPALTLEDMGSLYRAADQHDWRAIDPTIFGTLFESGLDPSSRAELGAHFTDVATIHKIIDPLITIPLRAEWQVAKASIAAAMAKFAGSKDSLLNATKTRAQNAHRKAAENTYYAYMERLRNFRVLDAACGSGNFLYLALHALKDLEHTAQLEADALGLQQQQLGIECGTQNILGVEINEYAAELARVTVWIGDIQWCQRNGRPIHKRPVLHSLDSIEHRDALLCWPGSGGTSSAARAGLGPGAHEPAVPKSPPTLAPPTPPNLMGRGVADAAHAGGAPVAGFAAPSVAERGTDEWGSDHDFAQQNSCSDPHSGAPANTLILEADPISSVFEAQWPQADVLVGNPPFLGDKRMRSELGDAYTEALRKTYEGRVPGGADLVCYWFDKARVAIEQGRLHAAGLVATNSIRGGKNRVVLEAIAKSTRIFEAWSDEDWVNYGAAVRVSLVAFGNATQTAMLDGHAAGEIHADLSASDTGQTSLNLTHAKPLPQNRAACFIGGMKKGPFDIPGHIARLWLTQPNPNGRSSADVVKPWFNGLDFTRRHADNWIVDFGLDRSLDESSLYESPFAHAKTHVKPQRDLVRNELEKSRWWLHARPAPDLRRATQNLSRMVVTPRVAKYRLFAWVNPHAIIDGQLVATARSDDTTFGILHSRFHELWSLKMCTWMGVGNDPRYTPTTCFETFPFPEGLTPADTAHQRTELLPSGAVIPALLSPTTPENGVRAVDLGFSQFRSASLRSEQATVLNSDLTPFSSPPSLSNASPTGSASENSASNTVAAVSTHPEVGLQGVPGADLCAFGTMRPPAHPATPPGAHQKTTNNPAENTAISTTNTTAINPPNARTAELIAKATAIATAAKSLNDRRQAWLNPPEWTHSVPEVIPLGMATSPYPDRIEPKPGISAADLKALHARTLTNLYNARPAWLAMAHQTLDQAVAAAYGWTDYTEAMTNEEVLGRLLKLNLERHAAQV